VPKGVIEPAVGDTRVTVRHPIVSLSELVIGGRLGYDTSSADWIRTDSTKAQSTSTIEAHATVTQ
jgi:hypothetical protein